MIFCAHGGSCLEFLVGAGVAGVVLNPAAAVGLPMLVRGFCVMARTAVPVLVDERRGAAARVMVGSIAMLQLREVGRSGSVFWSSSSRVESDWSESKLEKCNQG